MTIVPPLAAFVKSNGYFIVVSAFFCFFQPLIDLTSYTQLKWVVEPKKFNFCYSSSLKSSHKSCKV